MHYIFNKMKTAQLGEPLDIMTIAERPLEYSIIWPKTFTIEQLNRCTEASIYESRAILLVSDLLPIEYWEPHIQRQKSPRHHLNLNYYIKDNLQNKTYRNQLTDSFCFLAEKYLINQTDSLLIQFAITDGLKSTKDFVKYMADFFYFFDERFSEKYQHIIISSECQALDLNDLTELARLLSNAKKPLKMAFSPYFWTPRGIDIIKNSLSYKTFSNALIFQDIAFDGKTDTFPGEGIIMNKSAAEILLEKHGQVLCFFKPSLSFFEKKSGLQSYFEKCEGFLANILPK